MKPTLESISTKEVKCVWKSLSHSEQSQFNKKGITKPDRCCDYCMGYMKSCNYYIKRMVVYIK
jgi:hypothetical protein